MRTFFRFSLFYVLCSLSTISLVRAHTVITASNSSGQVTQNSVIRAIPGSQINLTAVQVDSFGILTFVDRDVEDFVWSSNMPTPSGGRDRCEPEYGCAGTNFISTAYGVLFDLPDDYGWEAITVRAFNQVEHTADTIRIENRFYIPNYVRPSQAIFYPEDAGNQFNIYRSLSGHGRWVYIGGEAWFVPNVYEISIGGVFFAASSWQPYQNGQWLWNGTQYIWFSYDPWGEITDHFGVWRHHPIYGWVWRPNPTFTYQPACVTYFYTSNGIGWYPYCAASGYVFTQDGFDDEFWIFGSSYYYGSTSSIYGCRFGCTYVTYNNFTSTNIIVVRSTDSDYVRREHEHYHRHYHEAHPTISNEPEHRYGVAPRPETVGLRDIRVVATREVEVKSDDGSVVRVIRPESRIERPEAYQGVVRATNERISTGRRTSVGSIVRADGKDEAPAKTLTIKPRYRDQDGSVKSVPVRTRKSRSQDNERREEKTPVRREQPREQQREEQSPVRREQPREQQREEPSRKVTPPSREEERTSPKETQKKQPVKKKVEKKKPTRRR